MVLSGVHSNVNVLAVINGSKVLCLRDRDACHTCICIRVRFRGSNHVAFDPVTAFSFMFDDAGACLFNVENHRCCFLALFQDHVSQNKSVVNNSCNSILSSLRPSISADDFSPTLSSLGFYKYAKSFAISRLIGALQDLRYGYITLSTNQTLDTGIHHLKYSDHGTPFGMRFWAGTDAIISYLSFTGSKNARHKLMGQVIPLFDAQSRYIGRILSVVRRNAQFETSQLVSKHTVK